MFCPFCGESNISVGEIQHDEIQAWIPCKCERCSREWNDIYQLTGYEEEVV
jgi:transposase-like protein